LIEQLGSAAAVWTGSRKDLQRSQLREAKLDRYLSWRAEADPAAFLRVIENEVIAVRFPEDHDYPVAFRQSHDPPEILFIRGELPDGISLSVVGSRRYTAYGKRCVETFVPELASAGLVIASGMALGIDGLAHRAALSVQGRTVAILGGGVDEAALYPREHLALAHQIMENGGGVVSEHPPGTEARKEHFPRRNRLIASYSQATLVVEANLRSGSLITARLAMEEGREVLAVPGPIWNEASRGTNQLLKGGARPCLAASDVLETIAFERPELLLRARAELPLDPEEETLLACLSEPLHVDQIAERLGLDAAATASRIAVMELKGLIKPTGGQMWVR
jgi:DNA processing protein